MYKWCFLACFCARQHAQRLRAELTLAQIREKLPNGCTDWHQIWHRCADLSGNGYTPNKLPLETQGGHWGGGGLGGKNSSLGKLSNGWTDWHQLWFTSADSSGNGHRLILELERIHQVTNTIRIANIGWRIRIFFYVFANTLFSQRLLILLDSVPNDFTLSLCLLILSI